MKDTARVLGRTFDGIEYRGSGQEDVDEPRRVRRRADLERADRRVHPTQILADVLTMIENSDKPLDPDRLLLPRGRPQQHGRLPAWSAEAKLGMDVRLCGPEAPLARRGPREAVPRDRRGRPVRGSRSPPTSTKA